jgi:hypothetical protein
MIQEGWSMDGFGVTSGDASCRQVPRGADEPYGFGLTWGDVERLSEAECERAISQFIAANYVTVYMHEPDGTLTVHHSTDRGKSFESQNYKDIFDAEWMPGMYDDLPAEVMADIETETEEDVFDSILAKPDHLTVRIDTSAL